MANLPSQLCTDHFHKQIPECQKELPKAPGGEEPLPEGQGYLVELIGLILAHYLQVCFGFS